MKKNLLLLILSFVLVRAEAQDSHSHWSIGIVAGPSFPTGHFRSKTNQDKSGYAATGFSAEVTGGYAFNRSFGLVLVAGEQENKFAIFSQNSAQPVAINTYNHDWRITRILTGGVFTRPFRTREKLFFQVRLLAGVLKTGIPGYSYDLVALPGQPIPLHESIPDLSMPWAFCYQADAGLKWKLSHGSSLVLNAGYSGAQPVYTNTYTVGISGNDFIYQKISRRMPVGSLHCRAGANISL
jgi:hypothetical protein